MKPVPMTPSDARPMVLTHGGVDRPPFMGMGRRFLRGVTAIVIAAIVNTSLAPLVSAAQLKRSQAATLKASTSDEQSYADALQAIYAQASRTVNPNARAPAPDLGNPDTLQTYADNIQAQWDALRAQWKTAGVSATTPSAIAATSGRHWKRSCSSHLRSVIEKTLCVCSSTFAPAD